MTEEPPVATAVVTITDTTEIKAKVPHCLLKQILREWAVRKLPAFAKTKPSNVRIDFFQSDVVLTVRTETTR